MFEELNCIQAREAIFKTTPFIEDKSQVEMFEELAKNVDWSVALYSLLKEVNDVYKSQND